MSAKQERNRVINKLKQIKERSAKRPWNGQEQEDITNILINLTKISYERQIQQEEAQETHDRIMDEMDYFDFND